MNSPSPQAHQEPDGNARSSALSAPRRSVGQHLRFWRSHRHMSQMDLANHAEVSNRHLSYIETGRSSPSREMVLRLAERLEIPLRERNDLLTAAGYAPMFKERPLSDPEMQAARSAVELVLQSHEPWPALAMDRHWNMVACNRVVPLFLQGLDPSLLQSPINLLRVSLHPNGLAPRIANLHQWRHHLFERLRRQMHITADPQLAQLLVELQALPIPEGHVECRAEGEHPGVLMPFLYKSPQGLMTFISTVTLFGSPLDITLQEMALETFFPGDALTRKALLQLCADNSLD